MAGGHPAEPLFEKYQHSGIVLKSAFMALRFFNMLNQAA